MSENNDSNTSPLKDITNKRADRLAISLDNNQTARFFHNLIAELCPPPKRGITATVSDMARAGANGATLLEYINMTRALQTKQFSAGQEAYNIIFEGISKTARSLYDVIDAVRKVPDSIRETLPEKLEIIVERVFDEALSYKGQSKSWRNAVTTPADINDAFMAPSPC